MTATGRPAGVEERGSWRTVLPAIVVLAAMAELALLWTHPRIPSNDGPAHQYSAFVAHQLREDPGGRLAQWFRPNPRPVYPNWAYGRLLEAAVGRLAPADAEKLFASIYLLALPLAIGLLAKGLDGDAALAALVAVPLSLNFLFFMGFFSFLWGVVLALLALAAVVRALERPDIPRLALVATLAAATWFTHLAAFGVVVLGAAALVLAARPRRSRWRVVIALAPIVLAAMLLYPLELGAEAGFAWSFDPFGRLLSILTLRVATAFGGFERGLFAIFGLGLCGAAVHGILRADGERRRVLVTLVGALLVAALAVPTVVGIGSFLDHRLLFFVALTSAVCIRPRQRGARGVAVGMAVSMLAGHLGFLEARWREFDRSLDRFLTVAGQAMAGDALYVHIRAPHASEFTVSPMAHVDAYVHLATGSPDFTLYQAFPPASAVFPIGFTEPGATRVRRGSEHAPIRMARIAGWAEEILLWDPSGEERRNVAASRRYALVAEDGEAVLFRRTPAPP